MPPDSQDHSAVWVLVFMGVAWLMKMLGGSRSKKGPEAPDDERTRKVREEIQRKIAERRAEAGSSARPRSFAPPVLRQSPAQPAPASDDGLAKAMQRFDAAVDEPDKLERQMQKREEVPLAVQKASIPALRLPPTMGYMGSSIPSSAASSFLLDLQDKREVRRAILLREILGPPVALR